MDLIQDRWYHLIKGWMIQMLLNFHDYCFFMIIKVILHNILIFNSFIIEKFYICFKIIFYSVIRTFIFSYILLSINLEFSQKLQVGYNIYRLATLFNEC